MDIKEKELRDLVRLAKKGNGDVFGELIEKHMQCMYKTAWTYLKNDEDVADVIQDTVLACFEKLYTLKHEKYFKTWLTRILINKCKDLLRKRSRLQFMESFSEEVLAVQFEEEGYADCEWKELIATLDTKYQDVIILYYGQGLKVAEIAKLLGINKNTVVTRLSRARNQLEKEYQDNVFEIGGYVNGREII